MRKLLVITGLVVLLAAAGLLMGCERVPISAGDENAVRETYDFTDFTGIEIEDAFVLDVIYADTFSIEVIAHENVINRVEVSKEGNTLKIGLDGWSWLWFWRATPRATVTMPALRSLKISGATTADVEGFRSGDDFDLELSGASLLDIDMETGDAEINISGASTLRGTLDVADVRMELSGASRVDLSGEGDGLRANASGASTIDLSDFPVDNADIELSGASHGEVDVSSELDVTLSGASNLKYAGNPDLDRVDVSGASSLEEVE